MLFAATGAKKDALKGLLDCRQVAEFCGNPGAKSIFLRIFIASLYDR
jgi:hypothetical protein